MLVASLAILPGCVMASSRTPRTGGPGSLALPDVQGDATTHTFTVADLIAAHNREPPKRGLPALTPDSRLEAAARRHASDMASRQRMSHAG